MKHKKYLAVLLSQVLDVPLSIQRELSLNNNDPHVALSAEELADQSLQLLPEKVPSDLVPDQNPYPPAAACVVLLLS